MCIYAALIQDDMKTLQVALWDVRYKWDKLGRQLNLRHSDIESIRTNHGDHFTAMLSQWLTRRNPVPTWKVLIEALKSRPVDEEALAENLATKYIQ